MLFNSYEFIFLFLPISFLVYFFLNQRRLITAAKIWLVFSSLFFYGWWNISYLPLIVSSLLFNYIITSFIIHPGKTKIINLNKKSLLYLGLVFNIGLLGYFKYMDFFIANINTVLGSDIELLKLALPLAISFFTLQQIAFLIDCYEGLVKKNKFIDYAIFVTFFPQLIAGPIVHHKEMMPQFANVKNKVKNYQNIALGLFIFFIGLFKKVVIADTFAIWATAGFDTATSLNLIAAWVTSLSYTFQLYFDFSGYTDMAIGAALLFNIKLPQNFNSPYKATGMIDFWSRWHLTLTNFITTYIYTPIIRSFGKLTFHKAMFATVVTFLIAGLWHGASWMFVIFGGLHGIGIAANHYWRKTNITLNPIVSWFITFNFINITFVFFRATSFDDATKVLSGMVNIDNIVLPSFLVNKLSFLSQYEINFGNFMAEVSGGFHTPLWILAGVIIVTLTTNSSEKIRRFSLNKKTLCEVIASISLGLLYITHESEFLYFNF